MKPGQHIKLADGRIGTVVYNSLDGVGIKWGKLELSSEEIEIILGGNGGLFAQELTDKQKELAPDAMLRDSYPSADVPCVGKDYELL